MLFFIQCTCIWSRKDLNYLVISFNYNLVLIIFVLRWPRIQWSSHCLDITLSKDCWCKISWYLGSQFLSDHLHLHQGVYISLHQSHVGFTLGQPYNYIFRVVCSMSQMEQLLLVNTRHLTHLGLLSEKALDNTSHILKYAVPIFSPHCYFLIRQFH